MAPLMASGHRPYIPMPQGRGFTDAMIICSRFGATGVFWARLTPYGDLSMGLRWPCAERRGGAKPYGAAETGGCQGQRPLWAREHHAKPGFKELLTLILGQPPRSPGGFGTTPGTARRGSGGSSGPGVGGHEANRGDAMGRGASHLSPPPGNPLAHAASLPPGGRGSPDLRPGGKPPAGDG